MTLKASELRKNLDRVRRDFVANVSHELKTPITAVMGYVETLLGGDYRNQTTSKEFLEIALRHVDRLGAIVEDLLTISRLEQESNGEPPMAERSRSRAPKAKGARFR